MAIMRRFSILSALLLLAVIAPTSSHASPASSAIGHVIVIEVDNTHYDDVVHMPHVLQFLRQGTLFDNNHSVLNSRTQSDMVSFMAGAYPDKTGILDQSFFDHGYQADYSYWENQAYIHLDNGKTDVNMGHNYILTPNPWQQFNDHGWDVGVVEGSNMALENTSEVRQYAIMNGKDTKANDYRRYAIHCAAASTNCAGATGKTPPHTIFGTPNIPWLYNAPFLDGSGTVGPYCKRGGNNCFPPISTLSALYAMQAHGVAVTYGYIDSPHETYDPGAPGYLYNLAAEDQAFDLFFTKLADIGITPANTLFVLTSDEGDQFNPEGAYRPDLRGWLGGASFDVTDETLNMTNDSGPLVYLRHPEDTPLAMASLSGAPFWQYIANQTGMRAIHNSTAATPELAARQPSFILYGDANSWWDDNKVGSGAPLVKVDGNKKWVHGTVGANINTTWIGFVGPGIRPQQIGTFVDQVDGLPTIDYLLGWSIPSYTDGRVLFEALWPWMLPNGFAANATLVSQLADAYKQINAPVGAFGVAALNESTQIALSAGRPEGQSRDDRLSALVDRRNALAPQLQVMINTAVEGQNIDRQQANDLLEQANVLMNQVNG
jgi:hypothetical protein